MPCTAWADQKWSTIPRSYLAPGRPRDPNSIFIFMMKNYMHD
ncbi:hypothetical protein [Sodalis sp. (in: enterobacteria)]